MAGIRTRAKKALNTAPSSQTTQFIKSNDVTLQTQYAFSKHVRKAGKAARASVDACWFSAKTKGIAKDCYEVYRDDDGLNYDASLNLSNIDDNNKKCYYVQLLCRTDTDRFKFAVWKHWGRVGDAGQTKRKVNMSLEAALVLFKFKIQGKDRPGMGE